jgi:flagellar motility protein MotE (MotC chaperone)
MIKLVEIYKQMQGIITAVLTFAIIAVISRGCEMDEYMRSNRSTIEEMKKDIEDAASKEALSEHISSSSEQRRQIEMDLIDHNERIKYLERR